MVGITRNGIDHGDIRICSTHQEWLIGSQADGQQRVYRKSSASAVQTIDGTEDQRDDWQSRPDPIDQELWIRARKDPTGSPMLTGNRIATTPTAPHRERHWRS